MTETVDEVTFGLKDLELSRVNDKKLIWHRCLYRFHHSSKLDHEQKIPKRHKNDD